MGIYYVSGIPYSSDELYHHGVKGQRWGVRRSREELGYKSSPSVFGLNRVESSFVRRYRESQKSAERMYKKAQNRKKKGKDFRSFIDRAKRFEKEASTIKKLNMQYNSLSQKDKKKINSGAEFTSIVLGFSKRASGVYNHSGVRINAVRRRTDDYIDAAVRKSTRQH